MLGYRKPIRTSSFLRVKWLFRESCKPARAFAVARDATQPSCQTVVDQEKLEQNAVSFNDTKRAYSSKTTLEILRGLLVFRLCSVNFLVDNNLKVCIKYIVLFTRILWILYTVLIGWTKQSYGYILNTWLKHFKGHKSLTLNIFEG